MAVISDEVKLFVVQALACFDTPSEVAEMVKHEFGLEMSRQQVALYDPTKAAGKNLSKKLRAVFESTRAEWKKEVAHVRVSNRVHRLRVLDRSATKAERARNVPLLLQILEQAAKEVGDIFVNRPRGGGFGPGDGEEPTPVRVERGVKDARRYDDGPTDV